MRSPAKGTDECLLNDILGIGGTADQRDGQPVKTIAVAGNEHAERRGFAAADSAQ